MNLYVIVRTDKMMNIDIMYAGSYNDCETYLDELNNDKKYDKYNEYHYKIKQVKKYKIVIEEK